MLTLICGSAVTAARAQLLKLSVPDDRMFVVPDELTATALSREFYGQRPSVSCESQIITFDVLIQRLTGDAVSPAAAVSSDIASAVVRNIIDTDPKSYDYLVGRYSVPRMSQGVLDRIIRAMDNLRKKLESGAEDEDLAPPSPRERQLRFLAGQFEQRLANAGCRQQQHVEMEALTQVTQEQWDSIFPVLTHVVFLDFLDYSDLTYMLLAAVARHIRRCDILLDFDPGHDQAASAMDAAYQRLYDISDNFIVLPEDLPGTPGGENTVLVSETQSIVVTATTVAQEVNGAAAAIRRLLDDASDDEPPSIIVALANWNEYAPILEKEFEDFGIGAVWQESESLVRSSEWLLLERLRQCTGRSPSGSAVSALFRAPGFPSLVSEYITTVESWDLASRLDYVLTLTGQLQGWSSIFSAVRAVLKRIESDRRRQGQWTDEEGEQDSRLLELIKMTQAATKPFSQKVAVEDWCQAVTSIVRRFGAFREQMSSVSARECNRELKSYLRKMSRFGGIVSPEPVTFGYFTTLFKTVINNGRVENESQYQALPVTVCNPSVAARLRSDCCMVLGCNDGNFPKFARPDAAFTGYSFTTNQAGYRARQQAGLDRILRNHLRVLLWMPSKVGVEDMLPSQFIEDLVESGRCRKITSKDLLTGMNAPRDGLGNHMQKELVESLQGLVLTPGELQRFAHRGTTLHNIASGASILAGRTKAELSGYDGIITDPKLKSWLAAWADRHIYSVSQLDSVVGCSFRFFLDRMLHLEEVEETDDLLPAHVFGSFTHDVLARFYRGWVAEGREVPRAEDEALAREKLLDAYKIEHENFPDVSDFAGDLLNLKLFGDLGAEGFGNNYREFKSVKDPGVLGQFLQMEMERGGDHSMDFLKPANFEVGFGMGRMAVDDPLTKPEHLELDIGEGERIKLRGRIDRIDISSTGTFAVTDYKTGRIPEKREILGGYRTQLPVYMMVGEQLLTGKVDDPEAAGGLYYSLRKGINTRVSGVFFRSAYQKQVGVPGRGLKDEEFDATLERVKDLMRHSLRAVKRGYLTTTRHDPDSVCRYCPFEGFCYRDVERTERFWQTVDVVAEEAGSASE